VFTKFAHGRRLAAGVAERWSREPGYGDVRGDVLGLRIAGFLHFDCYLIVIFLGAHRRREPQSAALRTTPDCRRRLTSCRHRESRLGPARTCAAEKKKFHGLGGGRHCFSLWFTMRVVADRACNHSPKLSAKGDRWRGAPAHASLNSSFRFADFASAPHDASHPVPHRARIGILEVAVARERPQREEFGVAVITQVEHAREARGRIVRLVPQALAAPRSAP